MNRYGNYGTCEQWNVTQLKKNHQYTFESILTRWMNLEPIVQSAVSQKEKEEFCILIHMYGI